MLYPRKFQKFFFPFLLLTYLDLSAGIPYAITGRVLKEDNRSLEVFNVLVLSAKDSTLLKGGSFTGGAFNLEGISEEPVILKVTALGYLPHQQKISRKGNEVITDAGNIRLRPKTLKETEITAYKPLFETKNGNTVVNVENTLLSSSGSVLELLSKVPEIIVSGNSVEVAGKGEAVFYLKGKKIPRERLSGIPVGQIQAIEIISNPDAKYDATGHSVINIIMKKNTLEGGQGTLSQQISMAYYLQSLSDLSYHYRKGRLSLFGNYGYRAGHSLNRTNVLAQIDSDAQNTRSTVSFRSKEKMKESRYSLGMDLGLDDKNSISVQYNGEYNKNPTLTETTNATESPDGSVVHITGHGDEIPLFVSHNLSSNFYHRADTLGSNFFLGADYSEFSSNTDMIIEEAGTAFIRSFSNTQKEGNINLLTAQADYQSFFRSGTLLETGIKYSHAGSVSDRRFFFKTSAEQAYAFQPRLSNQYSYSEDISGAYLQLSARHRKLKYSAGLRSEFTRAYGYSDVLAQEVIDSGYLNFFPTARLEAPIGKTSLSLSYSSRIQRPQYQDLDPFLYYINASLSSRGNPYLLPQYIHSLEGKIRRKIFYGLVGFSYTENPSVPLLVGTADSSSSLLLQSENLQGRTALYIRISVPIHWKNLESTNNIMGGERWLNDSRPGIIKADAFPEFALSSSNRIKLSRLFGLEGIVRYQSRRTDGLITFSPHLSLALGLTGTFMNGKLSLNLLANDPLDVNKRTWKYAVYNTASEWSSTLDTYFYRVTIKYNFGELQEIRYKNKPIGEDETDRINRR